MSFNSDAAVKLDPSIAYKLQSMGLIVLNGFLARPSCPLYRLYFREVLHAEESIFNGNLERSKFYYDRYLFFV